MKWTPIASVPEQIAEMFQDLLWKEGIVSRIELSTAGSYLGVSPYPCRILVPAEDAANAMAFLAEMTGQPFEP